MSLNHHAGRMIGRDPNEKHRVSTPLELLFDLTFAVAFSQVSAQAAHYVEIGRTGVALAGFAFTFFGATWAWINYSWLASAYDNDDVFFRIATLVQMIGVLVFALGIPPAFQSIEHGEHLNNSVIVAGYVVMRVSAVALWLRAARHDPARRRTCLAYATNIAIAQVFWVVFIFIDLPLGPMFAVAAVLVVFEMLGPFIAEKRFGSTPWHPHHIAERYGLLTIIALGEVVLGTILAISAVVQEQGWTAEAALTAFGGAALAFGLWWTYFSIPFGTLIEHNRARAFTFGYLHFFVFAGIVGIGAGLHVAAQASSHAADVQAAAAIWMIALPVVLFELAVFALYTILIRRFDPFHVWLFLGSVLVLAVAIVAVALGATLGWALVVVACSPAVIVVGYEIVGWRHSNAMLDELIRRG